MPPRAPSPRRRRLVALVTMEPRKGMGSERGRTGRRLEVGVPVLLVVLLGLIGCGGGTDGASTTRPPASTERPEAGGGEKSIEEFGEEARAGQRHALLGVFHAYLAAMGREDVAAACSHLASSIRDSLERLSPEEQDGGSCATVLSKILTSRAAPLARAQAAGEVRKVRVDDERAFVVFHAPGAELFQLTMVREEGDWKAATVIPSVMVPSPATFDR